MALQIGNERQGAVCILTLSGRLDTETASDLELAVQDLLGAGERHFLFDLSAIGYVSSAGLRVLLATAKQLDGGKGSLRLCGLNAAVTQVFDVAGFSRLFSIYPTRAGALEQHPQAKADAQLASEVARVLGAGMAPENPTTPQAAQIARAAAQILGVPAPPAAPAAAAPKSKPAPAAAARPARAAAAKPAAAPAPGWLGKLRALFGGK